MSMSNTIQGKSDQLNVDDIIGTEKTIQVEAVNMVNDPQQPAHIFYYGGNGIPWKPSLNMRRILFKLWGDDETQYVGRVLNLYVDSDVNFGKQKGVGGIRINGMSHIDCAKEIKLTVSRGKKQTYIIQPIQMQ